MFADIVGYSRQIEHDQVGSAEQVSRSIALFKDLIGDYGGDIVNIAGGGVLALFDSAEGAVRFAMQIQRELHDQAVWRPGEPN
jgi:class 3 adenylate cyclase